MELNVNRPALAGQNIDPDTFQRVWARVMPGQAPAARAGEAASGIPDTAVPAEPSVPPEDVTPQPPAGQTPPDLPPVPDCPAQELPPVPDCPARPSVPGCPSCPVRPCLGEASKGDVDRLKELMTLAKTGAMAGRTLARRSNGPTAKAMSVLAQDHRSAFRRLSAAYFLITGKRYTPQCTVPVLPASLPLALRQQFVWEQQWEMKNNQAAQDTADPCLRALYQELAQEGAFHAGSIRSILEQMG